MTQFAMQHEMMPLTVKSLNDALFSHRLVEIEGSKQYNDIGLNWADKNTLNQSRQLQENDGLIWSGEVSTEGILWGGCVESMVLQSAYGRYLPSKTDMRGKILFLETSENIPPHWVIHYLLVGFGERGWFDELAGVMIGRPKAWDFSKQNSDEQKAEYRQKQREAVVLAVREYNQDLTIVQNVDFGHTDPQIILPIGNVAKLRPSENRIYLQY